jgi:hypothetical protein
MCVQLQLQLQSGYLVTSASRHLTKDYIYTRAQQSLKVHRNYKTLLYRFEWANDFTL